MYVMVRIMNKQYIIICLKDKTFEDPATYVQGTRKRFTKEEAEDHIKLIAPSRNPVIVQVPSVKLDENDYPFLYRYPN